MFCSCFFDEFEANYTERKQTHRRNKHTYTLLNKSLTQQSDQDLDHYNMTEIIPSSKIFDQDSIFSYLNQQINGAKTYYDLHNLIHHLLPINKLKKILSNQLKNLRKTQKPKQTATNSNRSLLSQLYLQAASLEEIFCDDILVNIIKFLPSNHYPKIPCISRTFRVIMNKYPSIYRQYTVQTTLDRVLLQNSNEAVAVLWIVINHDLRHFYIINKAVGTPFMPPRNDSLSIRRQFDEDLLLNGPNVIKYEIRNIDDITNKVPFLWHCCKKWNIQSMKKINRRSYFSQLSGASTPRANSGNTPRYKPSNLRNYESLKLINLNSGQSYDEIKMNLSHINEENAENNLFAAIVNKSCTYIESLYIDNINDKEGCKWYLLNKLKLYKLLNHIAINQAIHNLILESWINTASELQCIKYLELTNLSQFNENKLKQMIELCHNLMVFECYINNIIPSKVVNNDNLSISFPCNIEFIRLQFVGNTFKIDLSQCSKLCALYLNDTLSEAPIAVSNSIEFEDINNRNVHVNAATIGQIIWPKQGVVECVLLDQEMSDVHNMNMCAPLFINEWYNSLKINSVNVMPVTCVRFITHPFIKSDKPGIGIHSGMDDEDDDSFIPGPPQLLTASPIRESAEKLGDPYEDYGDPFKFERDKIDNIMDLKELRNIVFNGDDCNMDGIVRILDGDNDHLYRGYLWKLLLRLKYKNSDANMNELERDLLIYQNWFDIGVGIWIRELGVDYEKHNFHNNASLKFLNAYPYSNGSQHPGSRPNGWSFHI